MKVSHPQKILIVRTDRIGDVVLSLPMISALRSGFPRSSISFLLRSYTQDLVATQTGLDQLLLYDREGVRKSFGGMLAELRKNKFDTVIVTYPTFRLAALMFLAGIPVRIGTGYRWYSLLFNRRVYEHRKTAEKHEAEYNLSLLRQLGCPVPERPRPRLRVDETSRQTAATILRDLSIGRKDTLILLHPGSGGSARDWKPERFGSLARRLSREGFKTVVTGGPGEEGLMNEVVRISEGAAQMLPRVLSLGELAAFISEAHVFVANSTGPLHIAAAVGTPVVGFYPPMIQCSSRRWGPLTDDRIVFEPNGADCPRCKGETCEGNECMDLISVEEVMMAVRKLCPEHRNKTTVYA
ncbi:MAG: glycosyltransferase family 9 protein [Ignavibacteriales bacterium]|nr:glycosyltransferase family 9 protein [Ignavibacteriales bacterium]